VTFPSRMRYGGDLWDGAVPLRLAHCPPVITCLLRFLGAPVSEGGTAAGEASCRHAQAAWRRTQKSRHAR